MLLKATIVYRGAGVGQYYKYHYLSYSDSSNGAISSIYSSVCTTLSSKRSVVRFPL